MLVAYYDLANHQQLSTQTSLQICTAVEKQQKKSMVPGMHAG